MDGEIRFAKKPEAKEGIKAIDGRSGTLKLLHIFPSFEIGGQQARLATLIRQFGDRYHHHIISIDGKKSAHTLIEAGARVSYHQVVVAKTGSVRWATISTFAKQIEAIKPDIVCTYNWGSIEAVLSNKLVCRKPHIHFEDGFGPDETGDRQFFRRVIARRVLLNQSVVVVPSHALHEVALRRWGLHASKVRQISNGVDLDKFAVQSRATEGAEIRIGSVGALRPEKNFTRLVRATATIDRSIPIKLEIVGEGPQREQLSCAIRKFAPGREFTLSGATSKPEAAYRRFDIFALSSDTEQAPISLMEAMAAGLPVVATDVGDIKQMVSEENQRFITPLGNEEAFVEALNEMAADDRVRAQLGAANAEKARGRFDQNVMVEQYRSLFYEVRHDH